MYKGLMIISLWVLTVTSLYCQDSYPKKLFLNKDTVICITPEQMIKINQVFTYSELLKESLQLQNSRIEEIKGVLKSKKEQEQKLVQNITVLSRYSDSLYKANTNTQLLLEKQKKMTKIGFISGATLTTLIFILIK